MFQCVDDMCRRGRSTRAAGSQGLQPYYAIFSSATSFPPIATRQTGFLATHFAIITRLSSILFRMRRSMGKHVFVARTPSDAFPCASCFGRWKFSCFPTPASSRSIRLISYLTTAECFLPSTSRDRGPLAVGTRYAGRIAIRVYER